MTTNAKNQGPIETICDGAIKATIWRNPGEKGDFYSVRITRTYVDAQEKYQDADSFSGTDLLKVQRLAGLAYSRELELRRQDREAETGK